jgi:PTS system nitrogen regulatory IIA component
MQLTVRNVAKIFGVQEAVIYQWIKQASLPGYRVNNQYRFNRAELLEWATARKLAPSPELFPDAEDEAARIGTLSDALHAGGIFYEVPGTDKNSVLHSVVDRIPLPNEVDRVFLFNILLAREALASTGIGDGIAFPHVRNPIVLHTPRPTITLCFLKNTIDFGAIDGKPVYCLFTIISPTVRVHLHLLSQLSYALRDPLFREAIRNKASEDELLNHIHRIDREVTGTSQKSTDEPVSEL